MLTARLCGQNAGGFEKRELVRMLLLGGTFVGLVAATCTCLPPLFNPQFFTRDPRESPWKCFLGSSSPAYRNHGNRAITKQNVRDCENCRTLFSS